MDISGTLSSNAQVSTTPNGKEVVNFRIVLNETYKNKEGKYEERTQFIRCAYWGNAKVANILTKGTAVSVTGWLENPNVWIDSTTGEAQARLGFTARRVNLLGRVVRDNAEPVASAEAVPVAEPADDLPF